MSEPVHPLDRVGEWELRISLLRNGRTVAIDDHHLGDVFDANYAAHLAGGIQSRQNLTLVGVAARWEAKHG